MTYVLGIHMGHDSSCSLVRDGEIIAAASEERFTRLKHYSHFPLRSLLFCLEYADIKPEDIDIIAIPSVVTPPEVVSVLGLKPQTMMSDNEFTKLDPAHLVRKTIIAILRFINKVTLIAPPSYFPGFDFKRARIANIEHHLAHAASAYYTSGFKEKTLIVTADGSGDGISTAVWIGDKGRIEPIMKVGRDGSLGAFYGTVTEALGWKVGDGEGTTMGLAPYGDARKAQGMLEFIRPRYVAGRLKKAYHWGFPSIFRDLGTEHWHFEATERVKKVVERVGKEAVAAEAQRVLEEEIIGLTGHFVAETGVKYLAVAGGVFLNVKANQRIHETTPVDEIHIYPDAGDGGISAGAALFAYYAKKKNKKFKKMTNVYLGPSYADEQIKKALVVRKIKHIKLSREDLLKKVAGLLADQKIVGWFQGRMEVGPRALGNRSILMDARKAQNKDVINKTVKYRQPFRPFCPSLLAGAKTIYLKDAKKAPFMVVSFNAKEDRIKDIPAVVHIDSTIRAQTVTRKDNPLYYDLIKKYSEQTGVPVLLNTSLNIRGKPIACTPEDAIESFFNTGMDYMAIGSFLLSKDEQKS